MVPSRRDATCIASEGAHPGSQGNCCLACRRKDTSSFGYKYALDQYPPSRKEVELGQSIGGIIAPLTTPFVDDELCISALRTNMRKYAETSLAGYFVLGSNGEERSLSDSERLSVLEIVLEERRANQIVIAGAGCKSTRHSIFRCIEAGRAGADFVSLITPSYYRSGLTDDAMLRYYKDVADFSPVPVFIYNAPAHTGVTLPSRVVEELSGYANIAGMKNSSTGLLPQYLAFRSDIFCVLAGSINSLLPGLLLGASGGVVSLADAVPSVCCQLYQAAKCGTIEEARNIHIKLVRLNAAVSGSFGVAGVKYAMDKAGYEGGEPRRPLLPLTEGEKQSVVQALKVAGIKLAELDC